MDITLSEHGMSLGRCPSLYSFCGDDLLFIVYPESGWKRDLPEADRQPPSALQSDGDRNMWILRPAVRHNILDFSREFSPLSTQATCFPTRHERLLAN